ncbi:MAG: hypothetical protein ACFFCE_12215 [Promethearchaeota archaeon]
MQVGDEWTYGIKRSGIYKGSEGINITSISDPSDYPRGTFYENGTAVSFNQIIDEEYLLNKTLLEGLETNFTTKMRSYAGVSCECIYIPIEGIGYMYVDTATGIVVETYGVYQLFFIEGEIRVHTWVISWSVSQIPENPEEPSTGGGGNDIPGYDIILIIGIITFISTISVLGFKKRIKI